MHFDLKAAKARGNVWWQDLRMKSPGQQGNSAVSIEAGRSRAPTKHDFRTPPGGGDTKESAPVKWHLAPTDGKLLQRTPETAHPGIPQQASAVLDRDWRYDFPRYPRAPTMALSDSDRQRYEAAGLQINGDTSPSSYVGLKQMKNNKAKPLGSGVLNTVYEVRYEGADGLEDRKAFKPMPQRTGDAGRLSGISRSNPRLVQRNLATYALAQRLGWDVVARTEVGIAQLPEREDSEKRHHPESEVVGLVMSKAPGVPGRQVYNHMFRNPEIRRELTKLQLLDHLTAQTDRHSNNYFLSYESGTAKVTGVDNDACFGKKIEHPDHISNKHEPLFCGTVMPPLIDEDMARAIEGLSDLDLELMLGSKRKKGGGEALISPDELKATKQRLSHMKKRIERMRKANRVVAVADWASSKTMARFGWLANGKNSYAMREQLGNRF